MCVYHVRVGDTYTIECMQGSDGNFVGSVLSFHLYLSSWAQTQVSTQAPLPEELDLLALLAIFLKGKQNFRVVCPNSSLRLPGSGAPTFTAGSGTSLQGEAYRLSSWTQAL